MLQQGSPLGMVYSHGATETGRQVASNMSRIFPVVAHLSPLLSYTTTTKTRQGSYSLCHKKRSPKSLIWIIIIASFEIIRAQY